MAFEPPIPGQTPIDDVSGLRDRSITTQAALNEAEAENIRKAVMRYLASKPSRRLAPFDVAWCRRLHGEMFGDVWSWAGEFRRTELNIGVPAHAIEIELHALLEDLRAWQEHGVPMLEQGARLHHGAVRVHPFLNGNGRWARMLANIWLKLNGEPIVEWQERIIGSESAARGEYLRAVKAADNG
ncbi:MAG: mobile mystery protein B, partial [Phycisphaerales bacterium]